jgi:hypothetical protein
MDSVTQEGNNKIKAKFSNTNKEHIREDQQMKRRFSESAKNEASDCLCSKQALQIKEYVNNLYQNIGNHFERGYLQ